MTNHDDSGQLGCAVLTTPDGAVPITNTTAVTVGLAALIRQSVREQMDFDRERKTLAALERIATAAEFICEYLRKQDGAG